MGQLRYWHSVELSAGDRPTLRETEIDILVEDHVGLYQGKSKILERQNGRIYLTSQRLIYIDNVSPRDMSLSLEISDVKDIAYTSKFLKSSPKITIFFRSIKHSSSDKQSKASTTRTTTWKCSICTFPNEVNLATNYSNSQSLPACQTCGVKADAELIKTAIMLARTIKETNTHTKGTSRTKQIQCSACTFLNHPSMRNCEICGSVLPLSAVNGQTSGEREVFDDRIKIATEVDDGLSEVKTPFIKVSFHKGGDRVFFERLQQTMEKLEWETLAKRGNVNVNSTKSSVRETPAPTPSSMAVGLHRLTQMEEIQTKRNEQIINSSLDDLQTLLAKAHEIRDLIESFKKIKTGDDRSQAKIVPTITKVTQEALLDPSKERQKKLYLQEVSRQLSEFLITGGTLEQEGGIITLMDLYALYNRGRVGLNLISPDELYDACIYFSLLKLPLLLKKINKVLVVQDIKFQDTEQLVEELKRFILIYGIQDTFSYKYAQILRTSEFFSWSLSITEEILKIGVECGALCVDQEVTGRNYYLNEFLTMEETTQMNIQADITATTRDKKAELLAHNSDELDLYDLVNTSVPTDLLPTSLPSVPSSMPDLERSSESKTLLELEGLQF